MVMMMMMIFLFENEHIIFLWFERDSAYEYFRQSHDKNILMIVNSFKQ